MCFVCVCLSVRGAMDGTRGTMDGKRLKAFHLGKGKHISARAKAAMLGELKEMGFLPGDLASSTWSIAKERESVSATTTPFGPLLQYREFMVDGVPTTFPVQHPLAMLYVACNTRDRFSQYMRDGIVKHGVPSNDAPWSIVLYFDEVTCGNPLSAGDKRQAQGVYWSIYQLGMTALSDESCWFEIVAFRTKQSKTFDGSMSHVVEVVLECFFSATHDLRTGAVFDLKGYGTLMLVCILEMLIADIKALAEVIGSNGPHSRPPMLSLQTRAVI